MITKTITIADGVKLNYIETDKFKTNYFSFNFIAELSKTKSCYYSLLPAVLMRGCKKYNNQAELNKRLQFLYSGEIALRNSSFGEFQIFGIRANMLNDRFGSDVKITEETIDLIFDIVFDPYLVDGVFDKTYTKGEKISLINAVESERNHKSSYSINRLKEEMCRDEVFSISKNGTISQIKRITAKSLYKEYQRILQELPIEIYFVGKCNIDELADKLKERFSIIDRKVIKLNTAKTKLKADKVQEIVEEESVKQGKLCLGFRTGYTVEENKYHLIQLFNEVFGASPTSKLFMNVREKMSLCYSCRSIVNQRNGLLIVSSGIEFSNKEVAQNAIIDQLEQIKNGQISNEEFESAKKSLINGYKQMYDSADSMENWTLLRSICNTLSTPNKECVKIENATIEDVMNVANKITLDTIYFLQGKSGEAENG